MKEYNRILIIKMSAMGDILHALPSLSALRELYPKAVISWLVEPQFATLLPGLPYVDNVIIFYKNDLKKKSLSGKLKYLWGLRKELHARKFDLVLDLQGLLKSTLIALLSGCRRRLGYCEMREGSFLFTKAVVGPNAQGHVIERYRDVIRSLGDISPEVNFVLPDFSDQKREMAKTLKALGIARPLAILFPGAGWASKLWSVSNFALLAGELDKLGFDSAIGGGKPDGELATKIMELARPLNIPDLTGKTDLKGLMGLVSLAAVCVGADTGPLHLAAAAGTPTVSLFGPSSGARAGTFGPLGRYVSTTAKCSPCFKRTCPKEFICMEEISVPMVMEAICDVLNVYVCL